MMADHTQDTVELIDEKTVFVTPDGQQFDTMDLACNHVEEIKFIRFLQEQLPTSIDAGSIAREILENFVVRPRRSDL